MNRITCIAGALSIGVLALSCEKEADLGESKYTPKLVVNSIFDADTTVPWSVDISKSYYILDEPSTYIDDAIVEIYEEDQHVATMDYQNDPDGRGYYQSIGLKPEVGKMYTLLVEKEGFKTIIARCKFPAAPVVGGLELKKKEVKGNRYKGELTAQVMDNHNEENYYHVVLQRAGWEDPNSETSDYYYRESFNLTNIPGAIEGFDGGYVFTDEGFNGMTKTVQCDLNTTYDPNRIGFDHFKIEIRSVSKEYYDFSRSVYEQQHSPYNKFVEIYSNVENGLGIFAGYNSVSMIVEL